MRKTIAGSSLVLLAALALQIFWLSDSTDLGATLTFLALFFTAVGTFRDELFSGELKVSLESITYVQAVNSDKDLPIVLSLIFKNDGYRSAMIENLAIKIIGGGSTKIYDPVAFVDMHMFIANPSNSGKRRLNAENIEGAYEAFCLEAYSSCTKHILCTERLDSKDYRSTDWREGSYTYNLYIQSDGKRQPAMAESLTQEISAKMLADVYSGNVIHSSTRQNLKV